MSGMPGFNPLLYPLRPGLPEPTIFLAFNVLLAVVTTAFLAFLICRSRPRPWVPSVVVAVLLNVLFQWPTVIFVDSISAGLRDRWWFIAAIHLTPMLLSVWYAVSRRFVSTPDLAAVEGGFNVRGREVALSLLCVAAAVAVYLLTIPLRCTALYAIFVDPQMTLLAREFSIKLQGTSLGTLAFGAAANTLVPASFALCAAFAWRGLREWKLVRVLFISVALVLMIAAVMLPGAKGNLVYTAAISMVAFWSWSRGFTKFLAVLVPGLVLYASLLLFELAKDAQLDAGGYDFVGCVRHEGNCLEASKLVHSLYHRKLSLNLDRHQVDNFAHELGKLCDASEAFANPPLAPAAASLGRSDPPVLAERSVGKPAVMPGQADGGQAGTPFPHPSSALPTVTPAALSAERKGAFPLALDYGKSIVNRALVVPLQVATWHFLYMENFQGPGLKVLPFARRLFGESVDMPATVYSIYGSVYSGGDRTYGSTAPTSFIFSYPAYWGMVGLLVVLALLIGVDLVYRKLVSFAHSSIVPVATGIMVAMALNFLVSDFWIVMISHGGAVGIGLLALFALARRVRPLRQAPTQTPGVDN